MFSRWFREVHEHPLPGLPIAVLCLVHRCGELCMGKSDILTMSRGFMFFLTRRLQNKNNNSNQFPKEIFREHMMWFAL
jgi:hypothetical protein